MKATLDQFLSSKRFWVAMALIASAVVAWKMGAASPQETAATIKAALMGLGAAYGLENVATAIPAAPKGMKLVSLLPPPPVAGSDQ